MRKEHVQRVNGHHLFIHFNHERLFTVVNPLEFNTSNFCVLFCGRYLFEAECLLAVLVAHVNW